MPLKYSEIFYSIQGEGSLIGVPSVFLRTSYCNLRCSWCDSSFTSWQPENQLIEIDDAIATISKFKIKHLVITGGEPLIQKKALIELCHQLHTQQYHITIETNGTLFLPINADLISLSPKLANSTPLNDPIWAVRHEKKRINLKVIRQFLANYLCQIKFVVNSPNDLTEIINLVEILNINPQLIILMPEGQTLTAINQKQNWIVEICKKYGYRYSPRLQLNLWGNQRGT